jgi:hypothetical protein
MAKAYLQITLQIGSEDRSAAGEVYLKYRDPFLKTIQGALSKELLVRDEDVQVLHGFETAEQARHYLQSSLFTNEVVPALKPYLAAGPEIRIYSCL